MNFAFSQRRAYPVLLTLLLLLLFGADPAAAHPTERPLQTTVCGPITANTTWTVANSPYIMDCGFSPGTVTVNAGVTLTIEPGVVVAGENAELLNVKGRLVAIGTAANPIVFTSEANNAPGQWSGIWFNGGTGHLNYTIVRYAGWSASTNASNVVVQLVPAGGEVRIENSQITDGQYYGMEIYASELHQVVLNNNTFAGNGYNRIILRGTAINTNATLVPQSGLEGYVLDDILTINANITLTMQPGAVLMGSYGDRLQVKGFLSALGTAANPIIFTSEQDNAPSQWSGLWFNGGAGHLNHAIVRYAGWNGPNIGVQLLKSGGEVRIENSQIRESGTDGLYVYRDRVTLNCVNISDNAGNGIAFDAGVGVPIFAISNSRIENNVGNGLQNDNSTQINARNTWWGDASGPGGSGPGVGDEVSGNVLFNPWLTTSPSSGCVDTLYVSSSTGGTVGGVAFGDEDILALDPAGPDWNMLFDGSDVGIPAASDVDAFDVLPNGTLLMSFDITTTLPGIGMVMDADVVRFTPTDLGDVTAGSFSWYLDGSDVGLTTVGEDIDALDLAPDGRLVVSTLGTASVPGATALDEDLLVFNATQLGATTQGTWQLFFDGSDVALTDVNEDVWGVWLDDLTQDVYLSTLGNFTTSDGVTGDDDDIFICHPAGLGSNTACAFDFFWNGALYGFGPEALDGFASSRVLGRPAANPAAAAADAATVITDGSDDALNGDVDDGPASEVEQTPSTEGDAADDNAEEIQQRNLFLPLVTQQ
jgi:hypothetical protein